VGAALREWKAETMSTSLEYARLLRKASEGPDPLNRKPVDERAGVAEASRVRVISRAYIEDWYAQKFPCDAGWYFYSSDEWPDSLRAFRLEQNKKEKRTEEDRLMQLRKETHDRLMCVVIP